MRELPAVRAGGDVARARERLAQQVVGLQQDLHRQAAGQDLEQRVLLGAAHVRLAHADQVVGKQRQVPQVEAARREPLEQRVVPLAAEFALEFELGERDRLGEAHHVRHPVAERLQRGRAALEAEGERLRAARGVEALRAQGGERGLDAPAPAVAQGGLHRHRAEHLRHRNEIERLIVQVAERRLEAGRAAPLGRVRAVRAQDVVELHDQALDAAAEDFRLLFLHCAPDMGEQARGHRGVAIDEFAVDLRGGGALLALHAQGLLALGAAFDPAVGERRQRLEQRAVLRVRAQHQGEVVAQPRQVAIGREQRRAQGRARARLARAPAGEEERSVGMDVHLHGQRLIAARR
ncbi:MAG: hypothetical protein WD886_00660 [Burkholderiales bacterium]